MGNMTCDMPVECHIQSHPKLSTGAGLFEKQGTSDARRWHPFLPDPSGNFFLSPLLKGSFCLPP